MLLSLKESVGSSFKQAVESLVECREVREDFGSVLKKDFTFVVEKIELVVKCRDRGWRKRPDEVRRLLLVDKGLLQLMKVCCSQARWTIN